MVSGERKYSWCNMFPSPYLWLGLSTRFGRKFLLQLCKRGLILASSLLDGKKFVVIGCNWHLFPFCPLPWFQNERVAPQGMAKGGICSDSDRKQGQKGRHALGETRLTIQTKDTGTSFLKRKYKCHKKGKYHTKSAPNEMSCALERG